MLEAVALNRVLDFLPSLDFGKVRSLLKVNEPVRPIPAKWRQRDISWILRSEKDHEGVLGRVYSSQDGQRLIFHCTEKGNNVREDNAHYLLISPMDYIEQATRLTRSKIKGVGFPGLYSDIEKLQDKTKVVSSQDRAWVKRCLNRHADAAPADKNTLG